MTKKTGSRLGDNPLEWIGKDVPKTNTKKDIKSKSSTSEKRETFIIKVDLSEKLKNYAYWERMQQKEVINHILEDFFSKNPVKQRPKTEK
jgi:hypothetical protein